VAFVLAAGGVPVVKFGNRAITSKSGSFDFLERIGIPVELPTEVAADILDETGLIFLFAPQWYPGLANLKRLRQMLSVPTVFNIVGPLLNPAKPALRLIGMMDPNAQKLVAQYLADHTATQHAWVVRSDANAPFGKDELDLAPTSRVIVVTPEEAGIQDVRSPRQIDLDKAPVGPYDAAFNAQLFEEIVEGRDDVSPIYHHVCLNAGAGFLIADKVDSLEDGVQLAEELLSAGVVRDTWIACRRVYAAYAG
jgi:anthranilate phosphoribosyltransferase